MKKTIIACVVFMAFSLSAAFAKASSVSVQIVQNNPGQEKVWATSEFFEQSMIDYFFAAGRIVSNSPICIASDDDEKNRKALKAALIENNDGGMDVLVRVELFFKKSKSAAPDVPMLGNIDKVEWKIYDVVTGLESLGGESVPGKVTSSNDNEQGIAKFAAMVAKKVSSSLE